MRVLGAASAAVVIAGCGGGSSGGGTPPPPAVASVAVTATTQSTTPCGQVSLTAQPRDAQGNSLARAVTWDPPGNPSVISLSSTSGVSNEAIGVGVGTSTVTARSETAASTPLTLTVSASGQASATADVSATAPASFAPTCVVVAVGGTVTWTFGATTHNVIFGTNKPTGGDIGERTSTTEQRTFPAAGNFPYQCTLHAGMNGRVIVR